MTGYVRTAVKNGKRIGLAPTMGYFHDGHLSLLRLLRDKCDIRVASIFVNPTQFEPSEDLRKYPRDEGRDLKMLSEIGCDIAFCPDVAEIYPEGFQTFIEVDNLFKPLCGELRPGHFRGVATIVLKMFNITGCSVAVFGLKDYQQAKVVERMTADLNLPVEIVLGETIRESDGLAKSSRNNYLSVEGRQVAASIPRALEWGRQTALEGATPVDGIIEGVRDLIQEGGRAKIQYIEIVDAESLDAIERIEGCALLAVAVFIDETRLIDNVLIGEKSGSKPIPGVNV